MRIRRRPPQISASTSSDPAAVEDGFGGASTGEPAAVGVETKKGETIVGTKRLHPSIEAWRKGGRPSEGDSSVSRRLEKSGGGGRGGIWTSGGVAGSCYEELQHSQRQKGKAEDEGDFGAEQEDRKQPGPGAQLAIVAAPKTWNHGDSVGGGLQTSSGGAAAAANGLGAEAFVSATATTNRSHSKLGAARKRKNIVWSNGINRSARPPSSSLSTKTEILNEGRVTNSMQGVGDHRLVKDEDQMKGEQQQTHQHQQQLPNGEANSTANSNGGRRRRSPAVLMEGSRCSRVNGRGWRCCQQTLVGYSLCEHHLGKGRLRSVNSVKCKKECGGPAGGTRPPKSLVTTALHYNNDDDDDYEEEAKRSLRTKHGKRIGTVKARSISSLLGQTSPDVINHAGAIQEEVAPMLATARTLAGLSAAVVFRNATPAEAAVVGIPAECSAPTTATMAAASLPPPSAGHMCGSLRL